MKRDCPKLEEKHAREREQANAAIANMSLAEDGDSYFEAEIALHVDGENLVDDDWYLDSGSSKHMTFDKEDLVDYRCFKDPIDVKLADKTIVKAFGFGKVNIFLREVNGRNVPVSFEKVLYVPEIRKKLVSISQILDRGESTNSTKNNVC